MTDLLLWTDVETTGLKAKDCNLLEVAAVITKIDGEIIVGEPYHEIIQYDENQVKTMYAGAHEVVQKMHTESGLWDALVDGTPLPKAERTFVEWIKEVVGEDDTLYFSGNSVSLDRDFITEFMPAVAALTHYRIVDISSLVIVLSGNGVLPYDFPKKKGHRALDDILESLGEYRWMLAHIPTVGKYPLPNTSTTVQ